MTYRPVPTFALNRSKPRITGRPGLLISVALKKLVVDGRYQRVFQARNEERCRQLAANWNWSLYTPILVAATDGDVFAIIDGQHRAAAAQACRLLELPAWQTFADEREQAGAFLAVNASPTRVDTLQLWHARHAAGDPAAAALWNVCERAGVEIARYPIAAAFRQANVTLCPGVLFELRQSIGDELLEKTLRVVVRVGETQSASLITRNIMRSVARLVGTSWKDLDEDDIAEGLALVDFAKAIAAAGVDARERGVPVIDCLCEAINERLAEALASAEEQDEPERKRAKG